MNLILIRHGETKEGRQGILLGQLQGTLSGAGRQEMRAIAKKIKETKLNPELIFSSDLNRAKQSAEILSKILEIKIKYNKLLRERAGGVVEGKKGDEIEWDLYEKTLLPHRKHYRGESFADVKKRAKLFLQSISQTKYKNVIILSHSVFLAMVLSPIKKWSIKKSLAVSFKDPVVLKIKRAAIAPLS